MIQFEFDIELLDSTMLTVIAEGTLLAVTGTDFLTNLGLQIPDNKLLRGITTIRTDPIFIPERLLGDLLKLAVVLTYHLQDATDVVRFASLFDNQRIPVVQMPLVQIVDVVNISPNRPNVNTGQSFGITCRVANLTALATPSCVLSKGTDGNYQLD